jgi:hypothetical protein
MEKVRLTLKEELSNFDIEKLQKMQKKLNNELKKVQKGNKTSYIISEDLEESFLEFASLTYKVFHGEMKKQKEKATKFRNNKGNLEKYGFNTKKGPTPQQTLDYVTLAYPPIKDDEWEVNLQIKLVQQAINSKNC